VHRPADNLRVIAKKLGTAELSDLELLQGYASIIRSSEDAESAVRNSNSVADFTEWLVCSRLGLQRETNSNAGFDAISPDGTRYEIKSRRLTEHNSSIQLSAIRNLDTGKFHHLVGVIYEADFSIRYAAIVPHRLIAPNARFSAHSNGHFFNLTERILGHYCQTVGTDLTRHSSANQTTGPRP
jgi:hypothetical protein